LNGGVQQIEQPQAGGLVISKAVFLCRCDAALSERVVKADFRSTLRKPWHRAAMPSIGR
jgi:hypothetical protein